MDDAKLRRHLKAAWLVDIEPTPLIAARVIARRRGLWIIVMLGLAPFPLLGVAAWDALDEPGPTPTSRVVALTASSVVLGLATGLVVWINQRADVTVARSLPQPAIGISTVSRLVIAGRARLVTALMLYVGALITGVVGIEVAESTEQLAAAAAFLLCVPAFAALAAGLLVHILWRPAIAVDRPSSLIDDQVRWVDARFALYPLPALLAFVVMSGRTPTAFQLIFMLYAVGGQVTFWTVELLARASTPVALAWEASRHAPPASAAASR